MEALWLVCRVCGDVCPEPDLTTDERDEWQERHAEQTGHQDWERRPVDVED